MRASAAATVPRDGTLFDFSASPLPPVLRPRASLGVLDVTKYFGTTSGGIKTYLLEKARYVGARPELRQIMVVPGPQDAVTTGEGHRIYQLRGPRIPANPPYRFLLATRSLRRIVEHERPDVIEVGSPLLVPWLARWANRRLGAPMVWYYHSHLPGLAAPVPGRGGAAGRLAARLAGRYVALLGSRFPLVLCASDFAARELSALGLSRVRRIPLGVDLVRFTPARRTRAAETRRRLGLPDGPLALYAGRFAAEKRIEIVLDAWAGVERETGATLALMGAGPAEARLRSHPYAERVRWLDYQHDRDLLADLFAAVDFYVAPGPLETFGLSVLEALASGTPVLSVDAGGGGELVTRSGAGRCYRDGDAGDAANAASWLARQDLSVLGAQARAHAERHHGWEAVLDQLFQAYRDLGGPTATAWPDS